MRDSGRRQLGFFHPPLPANFHLHRPALIKGHPHSLVHLQVSRRTLVHGKIAIVAHTQADKQAAPRVVYGVSNV